MVKKVFVQLFLFLIVISISTFFYLNYVKKENLDIQIKNHDDLKENEKSSISEISYETIDNKGRKYLITAKNGVIGKNGNNSILMTEVRAKIILIEGNIIEISSDQADYNNLNYNTYFKKNVKVSFLDHKINCDDVKILFEKNILEAFNNLTYENLDLIMIADKIEINMITKNSKIFNFDNSDIMIKK